MSFLERPPITLYLVRHGQSVANVDYNIYRTCSDHAIGLTDLGTQQATEAGDYLKQELTGSKAILLRSPYKRTRQTEQAIYEQIQGSIAERVELVDMCEQQLGVFNGVRDDERAEIFPHEYARFKLQSEFSGKFWATPPQGESPHDVYNRAGHVAGHIRSACRRMDVDKFILVSHGYWIQCFAMNWCNLPFEWFSENKFINNAEILKIEGQTITGTVFSPALPTAETPHAPAATGEVA